jgi:hypothetical protein
MAHVPVPRELAKAHFGDEFGLGPMRARRKVRRLHR